MSGNVSEWVNDLYDREYYKYSLTIDPKGANSSDYRILRGGSWFIIAEGCRLSFRYGEYPNHKDIIVGFRLIIEP
jgi:formylglycine-generating enzyme required for sulfatase activity